MIKKYFLLVFLIFSFFLNGEELVKEWSYHNGYYGSGTLKLTEINDNASFLGRFGFSYLFNHQIGIGLEFDTLMDSAEQPAGKTDESGVNDLKMGYGGFRADWIFLPDYIIHGSIGSLIGIGSLKTEVSSREMNEIEDKFGIIEPEINCIASITQKLELSLGISYRFLVKQDTLKRSKIDGFSALFSLRIGSF